MIGIALQGLHQNQADNTGFSLGDDVRRVQSPSITEATVTDHVGASRETYEIIDGGMRVHFSRYGNNDELLESYEIPDSEEGFPQLLRLHQLLSDFE